MTWDMTTSFISNVPGLTAFNRNPAVDRTGVQVLRR